MVLLKESNNVKQDIIWNIEKGKNLKVDDLIQAENIEIISIEILALFKDYDFLYVQVLQLRLLVMILNG